MKPQAHTQLTTRSVDNGLLVHDERSGKVHVLNGTAGRVLGLCDGHHDRAAIAATLAAEGGVDVAQTGPDVDAILTEFTDLGLLAQP